MTAERVTHEQIARALAGPDGKFYPPTPEQQRIIEAPLTPLLVTAGAGSGKTQTMMNRVLWQIANGVVAPSEIIGLTFTRKATQELRERLMHGIDMLRSAELLETPAHDLPEVSTYNSFADRLYRQNALIIGCEPDAQILDAPAAFALMREVVLGADFPELAELDTLNVSQLVQRSLALAGQMRDNGITAVDICNHRDQAQLAVDKIVGEKKLPAYASDALVDAFPKLVLHAKLADEYQRRKRELGVIEFSDQVVFAREVIAADPAVAAELRDRFKLIIFDEYQDTSVSQVRLLSELFKECGVVAVGDPKQSIYGWRGASADNMARFYRDFGGDNTRPMTLSVSFRNDEAILKGANTIAQQLPESADTFAPELAAKPTAEQGHSELKLFERERDEARYLANWFKTMLAEQPKTSGAVLVRARSQIDAIVEQLQQLGIPYDVVGRGGLLSTPEALQVICLLRAAADPYAGNELVRILCGAQFEIGLADIKALQQVARMLVKQDPGTGSPLAWQTLADEQLDPQAVDSADSLAEALEFLRTVNDPSRFGLSETGVRRSRAAAELLHEIRLRLHLPPVQLVEYCIEASGVRAETLANPDKPIGDANLDALLDAVSQFSAAVPRGDIGAFLDWLRVAEREDEHAEIVEIAPEEGVVQILTMHAAKGLEWDAVALPGLHDGHFPNYDGTTKWTRNDALPYELRADRQSLPSIDFNELETLRDLTDQVKRMGAAERRDPGDRKHTFVFRNQQLRRDEARRLLYVAMTRARHDLLLTASLLKTGGKKLRRPSEFWFELQEQVPIIASPDSHTPRTGEHVIDAQGEQILLGEASLEEKPSAPESTIGRLTEVLDVDDETVGAWTTWPAAPMNEKKRDVVNKLAERVREHMHHEEAKEFSAADGGAQPVSGPEFLAKLLLNERDEVTQPRMQLPQRFGASKLSDIVADPVQIARQLARPLPQRPFTATLLGNLFHDWVESLYTQERVGGTLFEEDALDSDEDTNSSLRLASDAERERLVDLQSTFLASRFAMAGNAPMAVELPISMPIGEFSLVGKIDAVYDHGEDGIEIVDWKTGRAPTTSGDITARELQLMCYAHAYSAGYDVPLDRIRATLYYVADDREISVREIIPLAALEQQLIDAQTRVDASTIGGVLPS